MSISFKVAFISDIHTDFYIPSGAAGHKLEKRMNDFIDNQLQPIEADILVFAGDNSHYPLQNKLMLELLAAKHWYKKIFVTFGNHDMYLVSNSQRDTYKKSWEKIEHLKSICADIDTVEFLDGNVVEVDGIKIGGAGMWYDFSYGFKDGMSHQAMMSLWKTESNDPNLIAGDNAANVLRDKFEMYYDNYGGRRRTSCTFNPLNFFEKEKEKLAKIVDKSDIFISHMGPYVPPDLNPEFDDSTTGFYFFDGEEYLFSDNAPKLWFFGHVHDRYNFKVGNTKLVSNPLGYKDQKLKHHIQVIDYFDLDNFNFK